MKNRTKFILLIVAMIAVVFFIEYRMPRRFDWTLTFSHTDPQPFGCQVFDSVLAVSMPKGYEVQRKTLRQLYVDSTRRAPQGIIVLTTESDLSGQYETVMGLARRGNVLLLASSDFNVDLVDSLGVDYEWNSYFLLSSLAKNNFEKGYMKWTGPDEKPEEICDSFPVFNLMVERTFSLDASSKCVPLAYYFKEESGAWEPIVLSRKVGKGEIILVSAPLLMTNYTMLDGRNSVFIGHLMNRMKHLHVVRTESYMAVTAHNQSSPFYVVLQQPPLRWALYLTMLAIVLFMVFVARRRQRVIPVVEPLRNRNLEFVKLIGTLYWQEGNHADLIRKKLNYTAEEVRRQTGLDILDEQQRTETIRQLAMMTGLEADDIKDTLVKAQMDATGMYDVSKDELKTYVGRLSEITKKL